MGALVLAFPVASACFVRALAEPPKLCSLEFLLCDHCVDPLLLFLIFCFLEVLDDLLQAMCAALILLILMIKAHRALAVLTTTNRHLLANVTSLSIRSDTLEAKAGARVLVLFTTTYAVTAQTLDSRASAAP